MIRILIIASLMLMITVQTDAARYKRVYNSVNLTDTQTGAGVSPDNEEYKAWVADGGTPDAAEDLATAKARRSDQIDAAAKAYVSGKYSIEVQSALNAYFSNGNSAQKVLCGQVFDWIKTVLVEAVARQTAVAGCTTIEQIDAISIEFISFDATKPNVTLANVIEAT